MILSYVTFNSIPSLPLGAHITDATLHVTFRSGQTTGAAYGMCQIVLDTWKENTITYNNKPDGTGGIYSSNHNFSYYEFSFPEYARAWYDGRLGFYGLYFCYRPIPAEHDISDYNSVVSSEGEAARAPKLTITYDIPVSTVTLSKTSASLTVGSGTTLTAYVYPSNALDKTITWSSSNSSIASVNSNGKITAIASGKATITAAASNGKTATCSVTVSNKVYSKSIWDCKIGYPNKYVSSSSTYESYGICWQKDAVYPYAEVYCKITF